jgi:hypothetical protein
MTEPFSLGIEGEYWNPMLGAMVIPVLGRYAGPRYRNVLVQMYKHRDGTLQFHIYHANKIQSVDNILLAAALVYETIEQYRSE